MQTIAINDSNDIYTDNSGNLVIKKDLYAMGDIVINKSETNYGELLFNTDKGIDFFNTIFNSPSYPDLFQNQLLSEIKDTDKVIEITNYLAKINKNIYSYKTNIQTEYGDIILNG